MNDQAISALSASRSSLQGLPQRLVADGFVGDFAITGEPTDMHVGIAAKGVVAMRLRIDGRAAHGATPWVVRSQAGLDDLRASSS